MGLPHAAPLPIPTGLSGHVADRPSVCVFCGNLKRSTTTPFCDACALQRSGHVVRSHVFAAGTGAHASVEFPQSSHVEGCGRPCCVSSALFLALESSGRGNRFQPHVRFLLILISKDDITCVLCIGLCFIDIF